MEKKSLMFSIIDSIPFSNWIHHFIKRRITCTLPRSEQSCKAMIVGARKILDLYNKASIKEQGQARFLEIGAGSDLISAICLRVLGVKEIVTTDVNRLAKLEYINKAASIVAKQLDVEVPFFRSFKELEDYGIFYLPYTRIQELPEKYGGYACIYSSDTLEHIGVDELRSLHEHARNLLVAKEGIIIHLIDVSDHYARVDSSITRFNFLTFSNQEWGKYNHRNHYVNRLRPFQYKDLFEELDFTIVSTGERY